jgi:hypothetical protein
MNIIVYKSGEIEIFESMDKLPPLYYFRNLESLVSKLKEAGIKSD